MLTKRYIMTGVLLVSSMVSFVFLFKPAYSNLSSSNSGGKIKGPPDAPVSIIDFSDFQCPSCRTGHQMIREAMAAYPGKIRVQFTHFPLNSHRHSPKAHPFAECANRQGKFWPFHDLLFDRQETWSKQDDPVPTFHEYAKEIGLDAKRLRSCLQNKKIDEVIAAEKMEGQNIQVERTPTFFINGERVVGTTELRSKIDAILAPKPPETVQPQPTPLPSEPIQHDAATS